MTQQDIEKSITTLLIKAVENGWNSERFKNEIAQIKLQLEYPLDYFECGQVGSFVDRFTIQLNDEIHLLNIESVIIHHEDGEVSFVEALCKDCYDSGLPELLDVKLERSFTRYDVDKKVVKKVRKGWIKLPTSERLDWFLSLFML